MGWIWAGLVACLGLWLMLRGMRQKKIQILRLLLSSMMLKLVAYAAALLVVIGFTPFSREWFVAGLLGGMTVFMTIEVVALAKKGPALLNSDARQGAARDA